MIILIIFTSLYLFITSDNYILNIYYLFINFLLYFFYINKKNFFRFYFYFFNFLTLVMPILLLEISIDLFLEIPSLRNRPFIVETLIYISLYLSILVMFTIIFSFYFSKKYSGISNISIVFGGKNFNPILVIILFLILAITSYFWLFSMDFYNYKDRPSSFPKFTNFVLVSASFLTTLVLCLGYLVKNKHNNYKSFLIFLYIFAILTSIFIGFYSGSRLLFVITFLCIFYNHQVFFKKKKWLFLLALPLFIILFTIIFYFIETYRNFNSPTVLELLYNVYNKFYENEFSIIYLITDLITDRFNYLRAINEIFLTYYDNFTFKSDYFHNIYGLIPRFLFLNKPVLGLDLNFLGKEMSVLDSEDGLTSYNLHFIGESFYQLWWFGLIIPFLQAIILAKIDSIKQNTSVVSHALLFNLTIFVVMTGTLLVFIPQLILLTISTIILSAMLNKKV